MICKYFLILRVVFLLPDGASRNPKVLNFYEAQFIKFKF